METSSLRILKIVPKNLNEIVLYVHEFSFSTVSIIAGGKGGGVGLGGHGGGGGDRNGGGWGEGGIFRLANKVH